RYLVACRSVFALTTHYEPFGLAPLEAMAAGLPAVVTRNGGPSESLFDADTGTEYGVLVDPTDPADVAAGLLRLLGPDSEWDRFHRAGRQRVLDCYTWERTAAGYLAVLDGLRAIQAAHRFQAKLPIPAYFNHPTPENDVSLSRSRIAPRGLPNPRFWPGSDDPGRAETRAQPPKPDLDLVAIGETLVDFISLEQTEEGLRDATAFGRHMGGSPANIAVYVAKLGGRAAVVSKTGADAFGRFLRDELRYHGVNTDYLVCDPGVHTTVIFVSRTSGTPDFAAFRDGDYQLTPDEAPEEAIARAKVVHASTFALSRQPCRSAIGKALRLAHQQGKIVSLDPNYRPRIWPDYEEAQQVVRAMYRYATITKPSLDDAQCFFGSGHSPEQYIQMFHELGPRTVILTMGKEGTLLSHDGRLLGHVPARPVKVVDATAAGDAFWAGFLVALLDGHPLARCVLFAREIAELKLTTVGPLPSTIDRDQIYARLPRTATDVRLAWS
ncbi:MAG: glycosyltransferase, partial [Chloroflexi bacterium]|nr:glycosyltransferase [Chloroflexota bacterium]